MTRVVPMNFVPMWRAVPAFPGYEVSLRGEVRSKLRAPRLLRQTPDLDNYRRVSLRAGGRTFGRKVSRLVLEAFVGSRPHRCDACHNNGSRTNDRLWNLRWDTRRGNLADCVAHGTATRGEANGASRLTAAQVLAVRARLAAHLPQRVIAAEFDIKQPTVSNIGTGHRWGWMR
jgi:hypothetical protein